MPHERHFESVYAHTAAYVEDLLALDLSEDERSARLWDAALEKAEQVCGRHSARAARCARAVCETLGYRLLDARSFDPTEPVEHNDLPDCFSMRDYA